MTLEEKTHCSDVKNSIDIFFLEDKMVEFVLGNGRYLCVPLVICTGDVKTPAICGGYRLTFPQQCIEFTHVILFYILLVHEALKEQSTGWVVQA